MKHLLGILLTATFVVGAPQLAQANSVAGTYLATLEHQASGFHQFARITLRTVNPDGTMRISANVQLFFGQPDDNEFLTYNFDNINYNLLTGQLNITSENADVSLVGTLRNGEIQGQWYSELVGLVGDFIAMKDGYPAPENQSQLVRSLSGRYLGTLENTNDQSQLPERVTISFVTTQDTSGDTAIHITGFSRFYLGDFDSREYIELEFVDIQFNFFTRFLTAKTSAANYGLTFKGYVNEDGSFLGKLYSDGLGEVGNLTLAKP